MMKIVSQLVGRGQKQVLWFRGVGDESCDQQTNLASPLYVHLVYFVWLRNVPCNSVPLERSWVWADCINWSSFCKNCVASCCIRTVAPFVASFQRSSTATVKGKVKHMYVCEGVARRRSVGCLSRYSAVTSSDDVTDWGRTIQNNCNAAAVCWKGRTRCSGSGGDKDGNQ